MIIKSNPVFEVLASQSLSIVRIAVPLKVQCSGVSFSEQGKSIARIKLVDCPVVESIPALTEVLYTGHL